MKNGYALCEEDGLSAIAKYIDGLDEPGRDALRGRLRIGMHWDVEFGCAVHAYVLMTNHVHLLVTPKEADGASLLMKHLGQRYVQYVNRAYRRSGTLWEGRFRSCLDHPGFSSARAGRDVLRYPWRRDRGVGFSIRRRLRATVRPGATPCTGNSARRWRTTPFRTQSPPRRVSEPPDDP